MASNTDLEFIGEIVEIFPAGRYLIRLVDMDISISGKISGKMRKNKITLMQGDYVKVELSEYDMSQGRIVYRFKEPQQALQHTQQADITQYNAQNTPDEIPMAA